jgi:peptidoglycan hydrolase-like protein with peptidoglycan-binding domain
MDPSHLDGDFGPETGGLVGQFQQGAGLVVDGIVGPQTWGALPDYFEASPTLQEDDLGPDVARLQTALNRIDSVTVKPGAADGWFGPQTRASVQQLQGGGAGVVDEQTWMATVGAMDLTLEGLAGMTTFQP